jgi:hypothetical protein
VPSFHSIKKFFEQSDLFDCHVVRQETKEKIFGLGNFEAGWQPHPIKSKQGPPRRIVESTVLIANRERKMDTKSMQLVRQTLTRIGELAAHPAAFGILLVYATLWFMFDRKSLDWHAFATLATWFMTLIIQERKTATRKPCRQNSMNFCV